MSEYTANVTEMTAIDGVDVDISVRSKDGDERKADQVLMDLQERVGRLSAAYDKQCSPDELPGRGELDSRYVPIMCVSWDTVFEGGDE